MGGSREQPVLWSTGCPLLPPGLPCVAFLLRSLLENLTKIQTGARGEAGSSQCCGQLAAPVRFLNRNSNRKATQGSQGESREQPVDHRTGCSLLPPGSPVCICVRFSNREANRKGTQDREQPVLWSTGCPLLSPWLPCVAFLFNKKSNRKATQGSQGESREQPVDHRTGCSLLQTVIAKSEKKAKPRGK